VTVVAAGAPGSTTKIDGVPGAVGWRETAKSWKRVITGGQLTWFFVPSDEMTVVSGEIPREAVAVEVAEASGRIARTCAAVMNETAPVRWFAVATSGQPVEVRALDASGRTVAAADGTSELSVISVQVDRHLVGVPLR
jgi:hypothetical protein